MRQRVASGDAGLLSRIPGIGRKTAQRLLLDLKDRVGVPAGEVLGAGGVEIDADVVNALTALGYSLAEAQGAVSAIPRRGHRPGRTGAGGLAPPGRRLIHLPAPETTRLWERSLPESFSFSATASSAAQQGGAMLLMSSYQAGGNRLNRLGNRLGRMSTSDRAPTMSHSTLRLPGAWGGSHRPAA